MKYFTIFYIIVTFTCTLPLFSEIEQITLRWLPGICKDACLNDLEKRLLTLTDIAEIKIQGSQNQVTLRWKPKRSYNYRELDAAMRYVGIRVDEVFVTVRGTLKHDNRQVILESLGDNSTFIILSPIALQPGQIAAEHNIESHQLQPATRAQLIQAENEFKIVKIEGALLLPERVQPMYLIASKIIIPASL